MCSFLCQKIRRVYQRVSCQLYGWCWSSQHSKFQALFRFRFEVFMLFWIKKLKVKAPAVTIFSNKSISYHAFEGKSRTNSFFNKINQNTLVTIQTPFLFLDNSEIKWLMKTNCLNNYEWIINETLKQGGKGNVLTDTLFSLINFRFPPSNISPQKMKTRQEMWMDGYKWYIYLYTLLKYEVFVLWKCLVSTF